MIILIPAVSAVGALLFLGIILNIFMITISYDFAFTPVFTFQMLLVSIWLIIWDYDRFRGLIIFRSMMYENSVSTSALFAPKLYLVPQPTLKNSFECSVYITGSLAGLLFFWHVTRPDFAFGF